MHARVMHQRTWTVQAVTAYSLLRAAATSCRTPPCSAAAAAAPRPGAKQCCRTIINHPCTSLGACFTPSGKLPNPLLTTNCAKCAVSCSQACRIWLSGGKSRPSASCCALLIAPSASAASRNTESGMVVQRVMTAAWPTAGKMYALLACAGNTCTKQNSEASRRCYRRKIDGQVQQTSRSDYRRMYALLPCAGHTCTSKKATAGGI